MRLPLSLPTRRLTRLFWFSLAPPSLDQHAYAMTDEGPQGPQVIQKYNPTFRTEPKEDQKFDPNAVKAVVDAIFDEQIVKKSIQWDEEECRELSLDLCDEIKERVKALNFPRYKIIVQVSVGENKRQGVLVTSRCLWNTSTDNYASVSFKNDHIWANAIVFGCYTQ